MGFLSALENFRKQFQQSNTMNFRTAVIAALLFTSYGDALRLPPSHSLHERRNLTPPQWTKSSKAPRDISLPMRIQIFGQNAELGHDHLMDISDPTSPNFGKHWTPKQIHDFLSPAPETVASVREWLNSSGIQDHSMKSPQVRFGLR